MSWTYKGQRIQCNSNARFEATIGDLTLSGESLGEVQEKIDAHRKNNQATRKLSLKVVGVLDEQEEHGSPRQPFRAFHAILSGINRTSRDLRYEGLPKGRKFAKVMPDTPENTGLMERLAIVLEERAELLNRFNDFGLADRLGWGRIEKDEEYNELLDRLEARYNGQEVK